MRVLFDTNVLVSALWKPGSVPDEALSLAWERGVRALYDARVLAEYRSVLARSKFARIERARVEALLAKLLAHGEEVHAVAPWSGPLADEDDRAFVEVALAGRAEVLVTGNLKDFPGDLGFQVQPPAMLLAALASRAPLSLAY